MATRTSSMRILAALALIAVWSIATLQPGTAQQSQTGILEPEAPALAPSLWATPLELDFGPVGIGETSDPQVVTVTNTGDALLANFSGGSVPAPFHMTNSCEPGVQPGEICQYSFWVTPVAAGDFNAITTVNTNAGPFNVALHADGSSPEFVVSPLSLDFGMVAPNPGITIEDTQANPQIVVVRNTGIADLRGFSSGNVSGPFEVTHNCPTSLPPGSECQYFYSFLPTAENSYIVTSTITTNAGSKSIRLEGISQSQPFSGQFVSPLVIDFGPVGVGNPGKAQEVILTNQSPTSQIDNFEFGELVSGFIMSQDCAPSVAPNGFCTLTFNFAPTEVAVYQTIFTVKDSLGTFKISLRGEGVRPQLSVSPLLLDFGPVKIGDTGGPQTITVKNISRFTVTDIITYDVEPPFSGSQSCAPGLIPGGTCELDFYYTPTETGEVISTTLITTAQMSSSIEISMKGGVKPPKVSKQFIPDTIPAGGTSTLELAISNPNPAATHFEVAINDPFPAGMVVATPLHFSVSPECGTPTFAPVAGKGSFSLADGTILGGKTCKIQLNVTAPLPGEYPNKTEAVKSRDGDGNSAEASLNVWIFNYIPYIAR